jgi:cytidylate kinase
MADNNIITIDGPAGSGKSTLAQNLSQALGWTCLDTGAIYRAVALVATERGLTPEDQMETSRLTSELDIRLYFVGGQTLIIVGDRDVSGLIRTPEISHLTSLFSAIPGVRQALMSLQRRLGENGKLVCEGRDMGTVVFPWAALKFYLTASPEVRAQRRFQQLAREGILVDRDELLADIQARDYNDSHRGTARLKPAVDAYIIDSTDISAFEVETIMIGEAKRVFGI